MHRGPVDLPDALRAAFERDEGSGIEREAGARRRHAIEIGETYEDDLTGTEWADIDGKKQPWGAIAFDLAAIVSSTSSGSGIEPPLGRVAFWRLPERRSVSMLRLPRSSPVLTIDSASAARRVILPTAEMKSAVDGETRPKKACECADRMEECDCPHCASMGEGFAPGACPCAKRGYR